MDAERTVGMDAERILVTGATGYVGGRLVPELLAAGLEVRCLARTPAKLDGRPWRSRVDVVAGDLKDTASLREASAGCDRAYYLVHSMGGGRRFVETEAQAALAFARAAGAAGLRQIVYLGGLGADDDDLSEHLRSRHEVGRLLSSGPVPVTELRAAMVLGSGSASFEMLRALVEVLPVMVTPRWVTHTRCQPIAIRDVLAYLIGVLGDTAGDQVIEIGGPEVLTYGELMDIYAVEAGLRRRIVIPVPVLTPRLSSHWVNLTTPLPMEIAGPLIEGLTNDVVVTDAGPASIVDVSLTPVREAIGLALSRIGDLAVPTRWSGADLHLRTAALPQPEDPDWAGGALLSDDKEVRARATPAAVMAVARGLGGARGWLAFDWLWGFRGFVDKLFGGVGTRRGRRHPDDLSPGDAVDFFRAELVTPTHLRLRAEMRVPGHAWLEWEVAGDRGGSVLRQRASFAPRGLWGRVYWYAMWPFHVFIFRRLAERIAALAQETQN